MKKLTIFAALCSLTLFTAGCDNSPAAKQGKADKEAVNTEADAMKDEIKQDAKDDTAAVNEAQKETDKEIDAETKAAEGK